MKSRFISDLKDASNSDFGTSGGEIFATFAPWVSYNGGNHLANLPLGIAPPAPSLSSEAVASSGGQSVPNSVVAETSGGITFNLVFDAAAMAKSFASEETSTQSRSRRLFVSVSEQILDSILSP